jgi:hypothetical protein
MFSRILLVSYTELLHIVRLYNLENEEART